MMSISKFYVLTQMQISKLVVQYKMRRNTRHDLPASLFHAEMTTQAQRDLLDSLETLYETRSQFSHLVIMSGGVLHPVHKALVLPRSPGLAAKPQYVVDFEGKALHAINLSNDDPDNVEQLIKYFYHADYEPFILPSLRQRQLHDGEFHHYNYDFPHTCDEDGVCPTPYLCPHHVCSEDECGLNCLEATCAACAQDIWPSKPDEAFSPDQLALHASMSVLGAKHDVDDLEDLAITKFKRACGMFWETPEFEDVAGEIMSHMHNGSRALQKAVVRTISMHEVKKEREEIFRDMLDKADKQTLMDGFLDREGF
jgi:hypothetical protein